MFLRNAKFTSTSWFDTATNVENDSGIKQLSATNDTRQDLEHIDRQRSLNA